MNALSTKDFKQRYIKPSHLAPPFPLPRTLDPPDQQLTELEITFKPSAELTEAELTDCFDTIACTSINDYKSSSWGWHPKRKKREMKEPEMRYLLLRSLIPGLPAESETAAGKEVDGFLSFMLTHDSSPPVPVLYVYEIHLMPRLLRLGLGKHLMQVVEDVARDAGVEKVMLTCFLSNEKAFGFYRARGYRRDVVSPMDRRTRKKVAKADYVIMSKAVE